jgi:hypothetical protein
MTKIVQIYRNILLKGYCDLARIKVNSRILQSLDLNNTTIVKNIMRATYPLSALVVLSTILLMSSAAGQNSSPSADAIVRTRKTYDEPDILSFPVSVPGLMNQNVLYKTDGITALFEFRDSKGLDPKVVVNQDKSIVAVNHYPATKTTYTHLFLRNPNGDLLVINSFNQRVAKLLTGRWAEAADNKVKTVSISGRTMQLSIFNYLRGNEGEELLIRVSVGMDGTLKRVR